MIDRSYLPYAALREYQDRGMAKWMGFFLSEHQAALEEGKVSPWDTNIGLLSYKDKLGLLGQCYASGIEVMLHVVEGNKVVSYQGKVMGLGHEEISFKARDGYKRVKVGEVVSIGLVEGVER